MKTVIARQFRKRQIIPFLFFCGVLIFCGCTKKEKTQPLNSLPYAGAVAILKAGEYPLWFQFGPQGPELLASIEDACFSRALVPWPLTGHIRFMLAREGQVFMAVNRDGVLRFAPWEDGQGTGMYRYSGGEFWKDYTVAAFFFYGDTPAALVYRDDHFIDSGAALPNPRAFAANIHSSTLAPLDIPVLNRFPPGDGWDVDALRLSPNGFWYFRAVKKEPRQGEIRYFRSPSLEQEGEPVSLSEFQSARSLKPDLPDYALPELPENFIYTDVALCGQTLIAAWEEQEGFNIGAAGFMVIKIKEAF